MNKLYLFILYISVDLFNYLIYLWQIFKKYESINNNHTNTNYLYQSNQINIL